jgi:hypothetical protein
LSRFLRKEDESTIDYLLRLTEIKIEEKPEDLDWSDIVNYCGFTCHYDSLRKAMQPSEYGGYAIYKYLKDRLVSSQLSEDNIVKQINLAQRDIFKERQKLRDEKNEYSTWLREQSRMELFFERIDEAVDKLILKKNRPLPLPITINDDTDKMFSAFADPHYGCEFSIKGFLGEIINEYNPDIFKKRMIEYRDELIDFGKKYNTKHLSLVDLGDSIEGLLHISQLKSVKGNIVDDIMDYADFIEEWLFSLSKSGFVIDFYTSEGNHSDLRLLTGKKGDFPHENLERVYTRSLKKMFKNNPNVTIHDSLDGLNYFSINGFSFLTAHGNKEGNLKNSISDYEDTYKISVDYFCVGHLHSKNEFEVAKGKEVIQVRSLMGINDFSKDIKKTSDAGATMFIVRKGYGKKYINDLKFLN